MSRREFMKINKGLTAFIAPSTFDPAAQNVNLYTLFRDYSNTNKALAYTFSDTVNTLTLSVGSGILYTYGYTRGGSDTVVSEVASAINPFLAGDTKRFVIVINTSLSFTAILQTGSIWAILGSKIVAISTASNNIYLKYVHFFGKVSLASIANNNFYSCTALTGSLTIPSSVTTIGASAFYDCTGLNGNLIINAVNLTFGINPFRATNLILNDQIGTNWEIFDKILYSDVSRLTVVGATKNKSGNLTIPSSVTTIGGSAFADCTALTGSLTIPASVTTIGTYAFLGCTGLTGSLTIPASVTTIGTYAFLGCTGLNGNLTINATNITFEFNPFVITNLILGDQIGGNWEIFDKILYSDVSRLTVVGATKNKSGNLTIPSSVATIGTSAFYTCTALTGNLTIPSSVTTIKTQAFYGCTGFSGALNLNCLTPTIEINAFFGLLTTALNLASGYNPTATGYNYTFNFNSNLTAASVEQSVLNITTPVSGTKTLTIGATNKTRWTTAYPTSEATANARNIFIV